MNSAVRRTPFVPRVDRAAPLQFLRTAYDAEDWIAVFLKRDDTGEAVQRVGPVAMFLRPNVQAWLRLTNARHYDLFVSVTVAVGTTLRPAGSGRPPHRSQRAALPHWAPASGTRVKALFGPRM
jgi:hypothetical protein